MGPTQFVKYLFWPPVETALDTKRARIPSLGISIYCAFMWTLYTIIGFFTSSIYKGWDISYAILFTLISWGLYKMRREAAIGGFVFCFGGLILDGSLNWVSFQTLIMLVCYFQAIRGTFAYVRLSQGR